MTLDALGVLKFISSHIRHKHIVAPQLESRDWPQNSPFSDRQMLTTQPLFVHYNSAIIEPLPAARVRGVPAALPDSWSGAKASEQAQRAE